MSIEIMNQPAKLKKINDKFTHGRKVDNAVLEQSCKLSLAMKRITEDNHAIGGTINCHGDFFRGMNKVGITG